MSLTLAEILQVIERADRSRQASPLSDEQRTRAMREFRGNYDRLSAVERTQARTHVERLAADPGTGDPVSRFQKLVADIKTRKGCKYTDALLEAAHSDPALHRRYLEALNPGRQLIR